MSQTLLKRPLSLIFLVALSILASSNFNFNKVQAQTHTIIPLFSEDSSRNTEYGSIISDSSKSHVGSIVFEGIPDKWHQPTLGLENTEVWRKDITTFQEIQFYAKADSPGKPISLTISGWPNFSNTIRLGLLDTQYKLFKVPISSFTDKEALKKAERLQFGVSISDGQYKIYIDDISIHGSQNNETPNENNNGNNSSNGNSGNSNSGNTNQNGGNSGQSYSSRIIYDGKSNSAPLLNPSCLEYGTQSSTVEQNTKVIKLTSNKWQTSQFKIHCQGEPRQDWSNQSYLLFYIKADAGFHNEKELTLNTFALNGQPTYSRSVKIRDYVSGGTIDNSWRLVKIPLSNLKTEDWNLSEVESIFFGKENDGNVYVGNIAIDSSGLQLPPPPSPSGNTNPTDPTNPPNNPEDPTDPEDPQNPPEDSNFVSSSIWNGDDEPAAVQNGELTTNSISGKRAFKATVGWSTPSLHIKRRSLPQETTDIVFNIKSDRPGTPILLTIHNCCTSKSNVVEINQFIQGNLGQDYKQAKIPINVFKNDKYGLESMEWLSFSAATGTTIYVDDIKAIDSAPNHVREVDFLSDRVIKIVPSGRYDMNDVLNTSNYQLSSKQDPEYGNGRNPVQIGRLYYVEKFGGSGVNLDASSPVGHFELYLVFETPMKRGKYYSLVTRNIKDKNGNDFLSGQHRLFEFDDLNSVTGTVKANQVGYLPDSQKFAYIGNYLGDLGAMKIDATFCEIRNSSNGNMVKKVPVTFRANDSVMSGEDVYNCDFSSFANSGKYSITVPGYGRTYDFTIGTTVYNDVYKKVAKALYYQRAGIALNAKNAGTWAREAGHVSSDKNAVIMENQNHSPLYAGETGKVDMSRGWYDAGDYGKYTASASVALNELLTAYELFPEKFHDSELNIPESGNSIPDIIDEAKWEIDWLRNMQSPIDGGVYHYVATQYWASTMPSKDSDPRLVTEKSTHATAQYAAIMAKAYSVLKKFPSQKSYANDLLQRSEKAWSFLESHPETYSFSSYGFGVNPPGIGGGSNSDPDTGADEIAWAAAELYKATGKSKYNEAFLKYTYNMPAQKDSSAANGPLGGWQIFGNNASQRASFAYATIENYPKDKNFMDDYKGKLASDAAGLIQNLNQNAYRNADQSSNRQNIGYGSYSQSSRNSWKLIKDYFILKDSSLLKAAKLNFDAQLGNNPLSTTFITGVGTVSPKNPLHTPSIMDGKDEPVPGIPIYGVGYASNVYDIGRAAQDPSNLYPQGQDAFDPYPSYRRYFDIHSIPEMSEFTIVDIAYTAAAYGYFKN